MNVPSAVGKKVPYDFSQCLVELYHSRMIWTVATCFLCKPSQKEFKQVLSHNRKVLPIRIMFIRWREVKWQYHKVGVIMIIVNMMCVCTRGTYMSSLYVWLNLYVITRFVYMFHPTLAYVYVHCTFNPEKMDLRCLLVPIFVQVYYDISFLRFK